LEVPLQYMGNMNVFESMFFCDVRFQFSNFMFCEVILQ
jgi:hypothetical protein